MTRIFRTGQYILQVLRNILARAGLGRIFSSRLMQIVGTHSVVSQALGPIQMARLMTSGPYISQSLRSTLR